MPNDTVVAIREARAREQSMNGELIYTPDNAGTVIPDYKVYVFNLSPVAHCVEKGSAGVFTVPACEVGEPYSQPLVLPSRVTDSYMVEQEMKTHSVTGEFMAQDIVHPTIGASWSFGQNIDEFGVFWTRNNPPTDAEIAAARAKMETTFRKLLTMATTIEVTNHLEEITPWMRISASYFGEDRPWNRIYKKMQECPNCGEPTKPGIITHSCGYIFDLDRAFLGGTLSREKYDELVKLRNPQPAAPPARKTRQ